MVENCFVGMKLRGVYEIFGGIILVVVCCEFEVFIFDRESMQMKDMFVLKYVELVYVGWWFDFFCEFMDVFMEKMILIIMGEVILKLFKGFVNVVS